MPKSINYLAKEIPFGKTSYNLARKAQQNTVGESRGEVIEDIERAFPYLDDPDMKELSNRTIENCKNMTDEEFEQLEMIGAE